MTDESEIAAVGRAIADAAFASMRSELQLSIGGLLGQLSDFPQGMEVRVDTGEQIGALDSYRGFYSHLAIEPSQYGSTTVGQLVQSLQSVIGKALTGYKGGEFVMHADTPVWFSEYGEASRRMIIGTRLSGRVVALRTADWDWSS